jgi:DNA-binding NtrC family response regulator
MSSIKNKMKELINKKIFVVDDDLFISELIAQHLKNLKFQDVTVYNDSVLALNELVQNPAIVFLDYNMDTLNGFELLTKIKRFNPNILVVMVSGQEDMNVAIESLKFGAFDYVVKGHNELNKIEEVLHKIEFFLKDVESQQPTILRKILSIFK